MPPDNTRPHQAGPSHEKVDAGPYLALPEAGGYIGIYDGSRFLFQLSPGFPAEHVREVCEKASRCRSIGYIEGDLERAARIRAALGIKV
jgi:hypothetical protein